MLVLVRWRPKVVTAKSAGHKKPARSRRPVSELLD